MSLTENAWSGSSEKSALPNNQRYMEHHTTIDDLARMINGGFKTTASKEDIKELRTEMTAGFDRIEHLLQS